MTVKFFPLFFWKEVGLTPIEVQVIYVLAPSGIAACSLLAQRASKRFGRVQTTVCTKLVGISLLVAMTAVGDGRAVVALYLLRTWLMNCCAGLTRSVLNDYVRKSERARWNAAESVNLFSWSGSAALGGYLIDRHGYRATFLATASVQFTAALILGSIVFLVTPERESRSAARRASDESSGSSGGGAALSDAASTSSGGYSLLDFDETLNGDMAPPSEMSDQDIDDLLLATANLVPAMSPLKEEGPGEGDDDDDDNAPQYTTL